MRPRPAMLRALVCPALVCLLVARSETAWAVDKSVKIEGVPHVRQKPDFCGEACVAMWAQKLGYKLDQDAVFDLSGLNPLLGRGCVSVDMVKALKTLGFKPGPTFHKVEKAKAAAQLAAQWQALHNDLLRGIPSIICMRTADDPAEATEHFRLILGYDALRDEVLYHEPSRSKGAYQRLQRKTFINRWPLKYEKDTWTVVRMRLAGDTLTLPKPTTGFTNADYCQRIRQLRKLIPEKGFTMVLQRPFVVIGDETPQRVQLRAVQTVKWATDLLKARYFPKDPPHIYAIWLFCDKASYEKHTRRIFGTHPGTPFGFCSSVHRALIMNIATGGGTLVHEMVHAFMASNFPACPAWFNEGLASLYEQCGKRDGIIKGFTNWRLRGLQKTIRARRVPSFRELCSTTSHQFYNLDAGSNYGQARYLCYYLQEQGKLLTFYSELRKHAADDPTGYDSLVRVLGEKDMAAFKKRWEAWVLELRFGR